MTSSFNTALTLLRADCSTEVVCAGAATAMGDSIDLGNLLPGDYFLAVEAIGGGSGNFVGEMLALTESRVCQIHSNVMGRLKGLLGKKSGTLLM